MAELILVKVVRVGQTVVEVMIPEGSTVQKALDSAGVKWDGTSDLRKGGKLTTPRDIVGAGDIITLIPPIRGGI